MYIITRRGRNVLRVQTIRTLSETATLGSGHNRWSKIKHDKAKEDASVTRQRTAIADELRQASKQYGPDPQLNPRLAAVVASAKKIGFPKASIENAIARGQGVSPSGATLENVTVEAMMPSSVAVIIECQTDSKLRTLSNLRLIVKEAGGTITPTAHMFDRKGRIVFDNPESLGEEDIFDRAIEAGALDIETDENGNVVIFTEAGGTSSVAKAFEVSTSLRIMSSELIWDPKVDMMVDVNEPDDLDGFLGKIQDDLSVQNVYVNAI